MVKYRTTLLILLFAGLSFAECLASTVKGLDISVLLHGNGSASITEHWIIDLDDEDAKTEWYVAHKWLGDMRIEKLTVDGYVPGKEGLTRFETLDEWDVDADREEKSGKCGLANDGQEICWGFGDWGEHEYVVRYELTHLVKSYDTCDGFNHCFVDMNCAVENAKVTITTTDGIALSEQNTRRWSFGFEGQIVFNGNTIVATPKGDVGNGKRIIVMLEMDKGMFSPDSEASESWAARKQRALDGSDYLKSDSDDEEWGFWDIIGVLLVIIAGLILYFCTDIVVTILMSLCWMLLCAAWWVVSLSPLRTWRRRKKLGIAEGRYFRDTKKEWTLMQNKMVVDDLSYVSGMSNERIIGALLLRLMAHGDVAIIRDKYKGELHDMLKIVNPIDKIGEGSKGDDLLCKHALKLLTLASGKDLILQPDEFEKWCKVKSHVTEIKNFTDLLETKYDKEYIKRNAADLFALKAFLNDFSLLNERSMMEVGLWDEYMVYAEFFGLTDQVKSEMAKICPEYIQMSPLAQSLEVAQEGDIVYMFSDTIYTCASSAVQRAAERSVAASGFSSFSSIGGGGGSSGGGGGGGR